MDEAQLHLGQRAGREARLEGAVHDAVALERGEPVSAFPARAWWLAQVGIRHLPRGVWQWVCRRAGWS